MATMITEVYDAFVDAGASPEKPKKAAEAMATYKGRFHKIESDLNLLKWMVGFNLAITVALLLKAFLP